MKELASRRRMCVSVAILLVFSTMVGAGPAHAVLTLYDDFNDPSNLVRSDLWNGDSSWRGSLSDTVRVIDRIINLGDPADPRLLIGGRLVVGPGATVGFDRAGLTALAPDPVGIQADGAMLACSLGAAGFIQAALQLYGFNDGTSTGPADSTGDIFTRLRISCESTNQAEITWNVFRCTNAACSTIAFLGGGSFGPANIGQEHTLFIDRLNDDFIFVANGEEQQFTPPGNPTAPPRRTFNGLITRIDPFMLANGGEFAVVATFDNVLIDQ